MAFVAAPLIGGLLAGVAEKVIIENILINVALHFWTKSRQKKKRPDEPLQNPSGQSSTSITLGSSIAVLFGMANVGGNVFDVINNDDGGYPVFGGTGYILPKDYARGVDLLNRYSIDYGTHNGALTAPEILHSFSILVKDADGGTNIEDKVELLKSIKFGNDASKRADNVDMKFFGSGGFSAQITPVVVSLDNNNSGSTTVPTIQSLSYLTNYLGLGYSGKQPFNQYHPKYILDLALLGIAPVIVGDMLRFYLIDGRVILSAITQVREFVTYGVNANYDNRSYVANPADPTKQNIWIASVFPLSKVAHVEVLAFGGTGTRKPDTMLQFNVPDYRNNNNMSWLAQEVGDPGNTNKNVVTAVPQTTVLAYDGGMFACENVAIAEYSNQTFSQLVTSADTLPVNGTVNNDTLKPMVHNPVAIVYEILVNASIGLGWSPSKIDIQSFIAAYNECYETDANTGLPNWKFGGYLMADKRKASEYIDDILNHIHADRAYTNEGKFKLFMNNGAVPFSPNVIDMSTILRGEPSDNETKGELMFKVMTRDTNQTFNILNLRYFRPDKEFVADYYLKITDFADLQSSEANKIANMDLLGFIDYAYVQKSGMFHMSRQQLETEYYEVTVDIKGQAFELGEILKIVAYDSPYDSQNPISQLMSCDRYELTGSADSILYFGRSEDVFTAPGFITLDSLSVSSVSFGKNSCTLDMVIDPTGTIFVGQSYLVSNSNGGVKNIIVTEVTANAVTFDLRVMELLPGFQGTDEFGVPVIGTEQGDRIIVAGQSFVVSDATIVNKTIGDPTDPNDKLNLINLKGEYAVTVFGRYSTSPIGKVAEVVKLKGIRMLLQDRWARIVEIKDTPDFKTILSLRQYVPEAYGKEHKNFVVSHAPSYRVLDQESLAPMIPEFIGFTISSFTDGNNGIAYSGKLLLSIISAPQNDRTIVQIFMEDPNTLEVTNISSQTVDRGQTVMTVSIPQAYSFGTRTKMKFYAKAVTYNYDNITSEEANSLTDLGGYTVIDDAVVAPLKVFFEPEPISGYGATLVLISKKYTTPDIVRIEIRKVDSDWMTIEGNAVDPNLIATGSKQLTYEQKENLPIDRTLTFYIRAFNAAGIVSGYNVDGNGIPLALDAPDSITMNNPKPLDVLSTDVATQVINNLVEFRVNTLGGSAIHSDTLRYDLYRSTTVNGDFISYGGVGGQVTISNNNEFTFTIPFDAYGGLDTVTQYFKLVAHDRISALYPAGETEGARVTAANEIAVTFVKHQTADLALSALRDSISENKFTLEGWALAEYKSTFGKQGTFIQADSYYQDVLLDADEDYVLSFWARKDGSVNTGIQIKVSDGGNDEIVAVTLPKDLVSSTGSYELISFGFHTESRDPNVQAITKTRFEIVGDGVIKEIMLNQGTLASSYALHVDDILDNTKNRDFKKQQSLENIQIINNISALKTDQTQDRSSIIELNNRIELKVSGDDVINSINIAEEGIAIAGSSLLIDAKTRFINTGNTFGKVLSVDMGANTVTVYNTAKTIHQTINDNIYWYTEAGVQSVSAYTTFTVSPGNERVYTFEGITSNYPIVGDVWSSAEEDSGGTTTINGGKITTESILADKIVANTIGTDKLISKEILTNLLSVVGLNTVIISREDGILIFRGGSYEQTAGNDKQFAGNIINSSSIEASDANPLELQIGDYVRITSTTPADPMVTADFSGQTLRVASLGAGFVSFSDEPFKSLIVSTPINFNKLRPRNTIGLTNSPNNSGSYIKLSAEVPDPLDSNNLKPGIQIVDPVNGSKSTWTVDNFFMSSDNSTIEAANGFFKLMKVGLAAATESEKIIIDGTNRNIRSGNYVQGVAGFILDGITGKAQFVAVDTVLVAPRSIKRNYSSPWHYGGGESPRISHQKSLTPTYSFVGSARNYETIGGVETITTRYLVGTREVFYLDSADVALDVLSNPDIKDIVIDIAGSAKLNNMLNPATGEENALMQWYIRINGRTYGAVITDYTTLVGKEHGGAAYASDFISDAGGNFKNLVGSSPGFAYTCSLIGQMGLDLSSFPLDELVTIEVGIKLNTFPTSEVLNAEYRTELFNLNISMSIDYIGKNSSYA